MADLLLLFVLMGIWRYGRWSINFIDYGKVLIVMACTVMPGLVALHSVPIVTNRTFPVWMG
ncbi:hypothetical protein A8C75_09085 [Marinobacterium aestuarii]|uniref:Uncharacterized protein n=1 Tax=Marinobacterium aestuarii TaxID=1821621 RepID=A0A1A9EYB5_9GAMM|nr:hypothetical protein A8C75_09085 [Marinobacterium aestuarii]